MQSWLYKRSGSTTKIHETSSASRPSLQSHSSATLTLRTSLRSTPLRPFLFGSLNVVGSRTTTRESRPHQSLVTYVDVTLVVTFLSLHIRDPSSLCGAQCDYEITVAARQYSILTSPPS